MTARLGDCDMRKSFKFYSRGLPSGTARLIDAIAYLALRWGRRHLRACNDPRWRTDALGAARPFFLARECSFLGPPQNELTEINRRTIRDLLDARRQAWESGEISLPKEVNVYTRQRVAAQNGTLAVLMPKYINCTEAAFDHDIAHHVLNSALAAGLQAVQIPADEITYLGSRNLSAQLTALEGVLARLRPSVIAVDGNFLPNGRTIDTNILHSLKGKFGFKIVNVVGDCYDHGADTLGYWHQVADLSVIFHRYNRHFDKIQDKSTVLVAPTVPFHEPTFCPDETAERDFDLSYVGSRNSRNRSLFIEAAMSRGVEGFVCFHDRRRDTAPTLPEYASILKRSKMVFTNGWIDSGEDIITGRAGEAILAGACLIHEVGSPISEYLVPFVHYLPVANLAQFVA